MPEVMVVSYPFLIRDNAELEAVLTRIKPDLDAQIQQNGFQTLAWARAGWIKLFSKAPVVVPNDLRNMRLGSSKDEEKILQAFKTMGYRIEPVNLNEVLVALNGGRIDSIYMSPIYVAASQLFGITKNMASINVAPFMGGILMNNTAWRRIPEKYRSQLLTICRQMEGQIEGSIAGLENDAVSTMKRYGLTENVLTPQQVQQWYDDTAKYESSLIGGSSPVFNREYYDKIKTILDEYRRGR
jgi:TRAP-type C4-dicarboxylate transport system substrate-binding protein